MTKDKNTTEVLEGKSISELIKDLKKAKEEFGDITLYYAQNKAAKEIAELRIKVDKCSDLLDKLYLSGLSEKQIALVEKMQDVLGV